MPEKYISLDIEFSNHCRKFKEFQTIFVTYGYFPAFFYIIFDSEITINETIKDSPY